MSIDLSKTNIVKYTDDLDAYAFLNEDSRLEDIQFLYLGGSIAYGLNNENSDVDIRGFAMNNMNDILLMRDFEQVVDNNTDSTIYSFNKYIDLLTQMNPNIVECLGLNEDSIVYAGPIFQKLIENKDIFISKLAANTFGGYAYQQLNRVKNNLARFTVSEQEKQTHVLSHIENTLNKLKTEYENEEDALDYSHIYFFVDDPYGIDDIYCTFEDNWPFKLRNVNRALKECRDAMKAFDKMNARNKKKDDMHMSKHLSHLIRLYRMGSEILEGKGIHTFREDRELLLSIKNGDYLEDDGNVKPEFWELHDEEKKRFDYAKKNSSLPDKPDYEVVNEFKIEAIKSCF